MTPTIDVFVLLPVLVGVAAVMIVGQAKFAIHDTPVVGLGAAFNFNISSLQRTVFGVGGLFDERQGHGRLEHGSRLDNVIKDQPIGGLLPQHLEHLHRRTTIGTGVIHQYVGFRALILTRGDIEIVSQGIGSARQHQTMLFVGIVSHC